MIDYAETIDIDDVRALDDSITVGIICHPARMRNGLLMRALASVAAQTRQPNLVVVVNDKQAQGAGWARQRMVDQLTGGWVAWLDSDDEWGPEHLDKLFTVAVETNSVYVYSWFHGGDPLGHFGIPFNPCTPHHTTMGVMERVELAKLVGFPPSAAGPYSNEDWAHILGVAAYCCDQGLKMTHLAERTWTYHQHGQNTSGQPSRGDAASY